MLFKAVCFVVSAHLVGRGFRFPIDSKLQIWNLADHQALPSLVFLPSSICSGSSNVTPASVVLLSTSLSALPPPPPLVSPLPPFTQLMPRYTGMHACTHPPHIPALPPSLAFPKHRTKKNLFHLFNFGLFGWGPYFISPSGFDLTLNKCAIKTVTDDFYSERTTLHLLFNFYSCPEKMNSGHVNLPSCSFAKFASSSLFLFTEVKFLYCLSACCLLGICS